MGLLLTISEPDYGLETELLGPPWKGGPDGALFEVDGVYHNGEVEDSQIEVYGISTDTATMNRLADNLCGRGYTVEVAA